MSKEYGYSLDDEHWQIGYPSMQEAEDAGREDAEMKEMLSFRVGRVEHIQMHAPDRMGEEIVNCGNGDLSEIAIDALIGCNEDGDFEGLFSEAVGRVPQKSVQELEKELLSILNLALARLGAPHMRGWSIQAIAADPAIEDGPLGDALAGDDEMNEAMEKVILEWALSHKLDDDLTGLIVHDERKVDLAKPDSEPPEG